MEQFTGVDLGRSEDMIKAIRVTRKWVKEYNEQLPDSGDRADLFCNFNDALCSVLRTVTSGYEDFDSISDTSPSDAIYEHIIETVREARDGVPESVAEALVEDHFDTFQAEELDNGYDIATAQIISIIHELVCTHKGLITYTNLHGHTDYIWSVFQSKRAQARSLAASVPVPVMPSAAQIPCEAGHNN